MGENIEIPVPRDEYAALCALQGKVYSLEALLRSEKYLNVNDALLILGFEPIEDEKYAGKPDAD